MKQVKSKAFILRNCFRLDPPEQLETVKYVPQEKFVQEEVSTDLYEGEKRRFVVKDYPITQEYVQSFLDGTDYRTNPDAFVSHRPNLGDIREIQSDMRNGVSMESLKARREKLADLVRQVDDELKARQTEDVKQSETESSDGGENNG